MKSVDERVIRIKFNADTGATMRWNFKPLQREVRQSEFQSLLFHFVILFAFFVPASFLFNLSLSLSLSQKRGFVRACCEISKVYLVPGETSLAFYTATNPTDQPVIGISTYNVIPYDAGQYFNKIQCFCFEEQMLGP